MPSGGCRGRRPPDYGRRYPPTAARSSAPAGLSDHGVECHPAGDASASPGCLSDQSLYATEEKASERVTMEAHPLFLGGESPAPGAKKGAIVRQRRPLPAHTVLRGEEETGLRLFPVLRRAWALRGAQARVALPGGNATRVWFGALNLRTGPRVM